MIQKIDKVKEYYNKKEKIKEKPITMICDYGSTFRKYGQQKHLKFLEENLKKNNFIIFKKIL